MKPQHIMIALLLAGCSKHIPVTGDWTRVEINQRAASKRATVVLEDGSRLHWRRIMLSTTTLEIEGTGRSADRTIPVDSLQRIEFCYHLRGATVGALCGTTIGALFGLGACSTSRDSGYLGPPAIYAAVPLAIIGAVSGLQVGYTYSYRFNESGLDPVSPRQHRADP
jgi:hypothetical protein